MRILNICCLLQAQDTARGWVWLAFGCILRTLRTVDANSDLGLAALIYYKRAARECAWDSENFCHLYLVLLAVVAVAAGTDYIISILMVFWLAAQHGRVHVALHLVSLACETAILSATIILQRYSPPAAADSTHTSTMWFLILSGALNVASFAMNTVGLRTVIKTLVCAASGLSTTRWRTQVTPSDSARLETKTPPPSGALHHASSLVISPYPLTSLVSIGSLTQQALGSRDAAADAR